MLRRTFLTSILVALLLMTGVQQALAWANGGLGSDGKRGNGIGTHDWVLARALVIAGSDGAWVNRLTAYRATDDPDTYNLPYHAYREYGGGAPYMVAYYYHKAVVAYRAGDYAAASKNLGVMSHFYSDITQPFHTARAAQSYNRLHVSYEADVGNLQHKTSNVTSWVTPRTYIPVTDVREKTIAAAKYSRARFPALLRNYKASRQVTRGTTSTITRQVLSRAANDLADIIRSIPTGEGDAALPSTTRTSISHTFPRQNQLIGEFVTLTDAEGNPMEGVGVKFIWRLPTGTKTVLRFTDSNGKMNCWQNIGEAPLMRTNLVTAYVPASGQATSASSWYIPTRVLAPDTAGFKTFVSNIKPEPYTKISGSVLARDNAGRPVSGLPVTFSWSLDHYATKYTATTGADGIAHCPARNVGRLASGVTAYFRAETQAGGHNRCANRSFWPQ